MAKTGAVTVIKKYANRRLYHTGNSAYVTLEDLADMVRRGEEFVVQDAKTGEDITRGVLGQIIFDAEARGGGLLPIAFLRQLITFYGGQMQSVVPAYLEQSLAAFAQEQDKLRKQMTSAFGAQAFDVVEEQVRANMDMFQRSMRMFMPFKPEPTAPTPPSAPSDAVLASDVAALRSELHKMQARLDAMGDRGGANAPSSTPEPALVAEERNDDDVVAPMPAAARKVAK